MPGHHLAYSSGYVPEHRLVWEQANGKRLDKNQVVHHIDGNPSNNDPANLIALTNKEHAILHREQDGHRLSEKQKRRYSNPEERKKTSQAIKAWWAKRKQPSPSY